MTEPILYDSHMHTPLCKHARGKPTAYAETAVKLGLKGITFTCHNPGPKGWSERVRMSLDQLGDYVNMVEQARWQYDGKLNVQLGLESDYIPGIEPFLKKLHKQADFQFILGSVHPQLPYYKETYYKNGDDTAYARGYFEHLAMAAESGLFDCLSHPDLIKNSMPDTWQVSDLLGDICHSLDRIAKTGVAMELNTSGIHKRYKEMNPGRNILAEMFQRNIPVVLGSDAHSPNRVAADFEDALETLADVGYTHITHYINHQQRHIHIQDALENIQATKSVKPL